MAEQDFEIVPEWSDLNVANAGVREGSIVRKMSVQEQIDAQSAKQPNPLDVSFQQALDQSSVSPTDTAVYRRGTGSESNDLYAASVFGSVDSLKNDSDIYDSIEKRYNDISTSVDAMDKVAHEVTKDHDEWLRDQLRVAAEASQGDVAKLMGVYEEIKKWDSEVRGMAGFEAYTMSQLNAIAAIKSAEGNRIMEESYFRQYGEAFAQNAWEETSTGRAWWDGIKASIGISSTVALADYTERFDAGTVGSVVNTLGETVGRVFDASLTGKGFDAYKQTLEQFWQQPVTKRVLMFNTIEKHIREISFNEEAGASNVFVYMALIEPFVDKSSAIGVNLDYLMDSATVLGWTPLKTAGKVLKFARGVSQAKKPIKILINTGNETKAGQLINKALTDREERVRRIVGMSRAEVAHSANMMDMTNAVPEQIVGAAGEASKQLEKDVLEKVGIVDQAFIHTTDPTLTPVRYYYDEAAKMARRREVLGDLNDDIKVATIVDQTETGFTVQVDRIFNPQSLFDKETREASLAVARRNLEEARDQLAILGQIKPSKTPGKPTLTADPRTQALIEKANLYKKQVEMNERILQDLNTPREARIEKINYTFDEAGRQDAVQLQGMTLPHIASPSQVQDQLVHGASDAATLAEFTGTKILNNLNTAARDVLRGLTGGQVKAVDAILGYGDEAGRVFTVSELIGGVTTRQGLVKLDSTKSIAAYYAKRAAFDHIHRIENYLKRRGLENAGFSELHSNMRLRDGTTAKMYAKRMTGSIPDGVRRIYDHQGGGVRNVEDIANLDGRLRGGWQVVRFRTGVRTGDEIINYGLVRDTDLKPISGQVLNYRPGYVPKLRQGVFYVASRRFKRLVDGVNKDAIETVRFFRNRNDAERWRLQQEGAENIDIVPDKQYRSPTHESFDEEFDDLNFGGLYFGERTEREILMGLDGTEANRVSAYKSLSMNLAHIANRYPINELRMGLVGRFQNTYGEYLQNPTNWEGPLSREARNNTQLAQSIEAQRRYIKDLMRTPTMSEEWWNNKMRAIAESISARPVIPVFTGTGVRNISPGAADFFMNLAGKDPISVVRAVTFHQYLGAFNPAQVFVQGMGFATAMAAYPGKALKLLPQNIALMAAWTGRKNPSAMKMMAGWADVDDAELFKIVREIERVGLFDSLKTTADYQASEAGFSTSADAIRRMSDAGLVFMRGGEQWARGYGYLLARDMFLSRQKKGYKLTDKDIDRIAADSWRFTLNLNRSNRAWWQKGLLSIPTQFYQVYMKFLENLVGGSLGLGVRKWTPAEKMKVMLGYFAMFGAAGVPTLDSWVADAINARNSATDDPEGLTVDNVNPFNLLPPELASNDEAFARFVRGGVVQTMAAWTGADPELSTRFSIVGGIEESFDLYKSGNRDLANFIGGAAAPGLMRWYDAAVGLAQVFGPSGPPNLTNDEMRQAVREVAGIFSSTRNAYAKAAWWAEIGKITNRKGERMFGEMSNDEFDATLTWQALGFAPAKVGWMYDLEGGTRELEGRVEDALGETQLIMAKYAPSWDYVDSEQKRENIRFRINLLTTGFTPAEQEKYYEGLKNISEKIYGDKDKMSEIIARAIEATATAGGRVTSGSVANPLTVPAGGNVNAD